MVDMKDHVGRPAPAFRAAVRRVPEQPKEVPGRDRLAGVSFTGELNSSVEHIDVSIRPVSASLLSKKVAEAPQAIGAVP